MYVQGRATPPSFSVILASVSPPLLDVMDLEHAWMDLMK